MAVKYGLGSGRTIYPRSVLAALIAGVLVPTACVLWFMTEAVRNEHLAVRQKLMHIYRDQLAVAKKQLLSQWQIRIADATEIAAERPPARAFADIVGRGLASSALIQGKAEHRAYPSPSPPHTPAPPLSIAWQQAQRWEYQELDFSRAATAYAGIAEQAPKAAEAAQGLLARARCLEKAGKSAAALQVLTAELMADRFDGTRDWRGRFIQPNALLHALRIMEAGADLGNETAINELKRRLEQRLADYSNPVLPSSQRVFLMRQLQKSSSAGRLPDPERFSTFEAETLALTYLETRPQVSPQRPDTHLRETAIAGSWELPRPDQGITLLFTSGFIKADIERWDLHQLLPQGTRVALLRAIDLPNPPPLITLPLDDYLTGWQLSLTLEDPSWLSTAADSRIAAYLWTGALIIVATVIMVGILARYISRQLTLNRLKNDLVATVSHELKTPLSSMRVLVDTLLENDNQNPQQTREYLQIIARENHRLSRLIDNFLTFSRLDSQRQAPDFSPVSIEEVFTIAVDAIREKFNAAGFAIEVQIAPDLPRIFGDTDLLVTVVINLLDNAYKYSDKEKRVTLRTYLEKSNICIEVQDRGIGLTLLQSKKIFRRFYRADNRLSRTVEGCGLGLTVVEHIVKAHNGNISVESQPGQGSTFKVHLPL